MATTLYIVMPGLDPGIHALRATTKGVDGRERSGEGRIRMAACGEGEANSIDLASGADDKMFKLTKAPVKVCWGDAR